MTGSVCSASSAELHGGICRQLLFLARGNNLVEPSFEIATETISDLENFG